MNPYDSKHLRLLGLVQDRRWAEIEHDDIHELKVLITCKYIVVKSPSGQVPSMNLNPEGAHYFERLSQLALRSSTPFQSSVITA